MSKENIYNLHFVCKQGTIGGCFIAKEDEVNKLIGKTVYFNQPFGKHSEISDEITEKDISVYSSKPDDVESAKKLFGIRISGYYPFEHLSEDDEQYI